MVERVVRGPFDRTSVPTVVEGASLTKQSFRDECDINKLMSKYQKQGVISHVNVRPPQYGDFTNIVEYDAALRMVAAAQAAFAALPSAVRSRFDNDPAGFLDFVQNPDTPEQELRDLGLLKPGEGRDGKPLPVEPVVAPAPANAAPAAAGGSPSNPPAVPG